MKKLFKTLFFVAVICIVFVVSKNYFFKDNESGKNENKVVQSVEKTNQQSDEMLIKKIRSSGSAELSLKQLKSLKTIQTNQFKKYASLISSVGDKGKKYYSFLGYSDRIEWCAAFVSYFSNKYDLGLPTNEVLAENYRVFGKEQGTFYTDINKVKPLDAVTFDWNKNDSSDHVGFVLCKIGKYIITIEGNTNPNIRQIKNDKMTVDLTIQSHGTDRVRCFAYKKDEYILGYTRGKK